MEPIKLWCHTVNHPGALEPTRTYALDPETRGAIHLPPERRHHRTGRVALTGAEQPLIPLKQRALVEMLTGLRGVELDGARVNVYEDDYEGERARLMESWTL